MAAWMKLDAKRRQVAIAGRVIEAITKTAIAGAEIQIEQAPDEFRQTLKLKAMQYSDGWQTKPERLDRTHSAIDGYFCFLDLPNGAYTLTVSLPGTGTRYGTISTNPVTISRNPQGSLQKATVEIVLPSTALMGKITRANQPVSMARVQVEGSTESVFSNQEGIYLLTGLEVWQSSSQSPRPTVQVFTRGYPTYTKGVKLSRGILTTLDFQLDKPPPDLPK